MSLEKKSLKFVLKDKLGRYLSVSVYFSAFYFIFRLSSCSVADLWSFIHNMAITTRQEYQNLVEISLTTTHHVTCIL